MNKPKQLLKKIQKLDLVNKVKLLKAKNDYSSAKNLITKAKEDVAASELAYNSMEKSYSLSYIKNSHIFESYLNNVKKLEDNVSAAEVALIEKQRILVKKKEQLLIKFTRSKFTEEHKINVNNVYQKQLLDIEHKYIDIK